MVNFQENELTSGVPYSCVAGYAGLCKFFNSLRKKAHYPPYMYTYVHTYKYTYIYMYMHI